jgi:hypothetical protein
VHAIIEIVLGPWTMILIAAISLVAICVGLPKAILAGLELVEELASRSSEIRTGAANAYRKRLHPRRRLAPSKDREVPERIA